MLVINLHSFQKYTSSRVSYTNIIFSLKLCNFYIDEHNNIKLGDFGFACLLSNFN
jgi:hypothetical protein